MNSKILVAILVTISAAHVSGQFYEDKRCRCICPSPAALLNKTLTNRKVFTSYVPPNKCNCENVILPVIGTDIQVHIQEFCPRCDCKYQTRNTTIIMVVVIMILWVLTMLSGYMAFLKCLNPLIKKRRRGKFHNEMTPGCEEARTLLLEDAED